MDTFAVCFCVVRPYVSETWIRLPCVSLCSVLMLLSQGSSSLSLHDPSYACCRALWLDILALIVLGFAASLALVPTYDKLLDAAE